MSSTSSTPTSRTRDSRTWPGQRGLSAETIGALQPATAPAVEAARFVGAANDAGGSTPLRRDTTVASGAAPVMEARDTVLRAVAEGTALALEEWANAHASQRAFVIDVPGRLVPLGTARHDAPSR